MEGIGYWIFLIILYGLSSYLRKRRRQQARNALESEGQNQGEDKPRQDWRRSDIFKELFGGTAPEPEPATTGPEDTNIFDWDQEEEPAYTVPAEPELEPKKPVTEPVRIERSKRESTPRERRKRIRRDSKRVKEISHLDSVRSMLKQRNSLQQAIIMREIIEKPLALRGKKLR